jgi:hypothetical protein
MKIFDDEFKKKVAVFQRRYGLLHFIFFEYFTEDEIQEWNDHAGGLVLTHENGESYSVTGFNWFIKLNMERMDEGNPICLSPLQEFSHCGN